MENIRVKSADLVSVNNENEPLISTLLLDIPGTNGKIFCLIRLLGRTNEDRERIANTILGHLKRLCATLSDQTNIPRRFEQVLQAINEDVFEAHSEGSKIPITDFHAVIGVLDKNQIFISGIGHLHALFMHRTTSQRYVLYELDKQFTSEEGFSWKKPFIAVLDGEISKGDVFYLATRVSAHEINMSDLQDTLVTLPPSGALKRIQQHLNIDTPYGAICIKIADEISKGAPKKTNPITSIEQLGKTKEDTATLLGEQTPDLGGYLSRISKPLLNKLSAPGTKGFTSTVKLILRSVIKILVMIASILSKAGKVLFEILKKLFKNRQSTLHKIKNILEFGINKIKNLPKITKYIALLVVIIVIILFSTFSYSSKLSKKHQAEAEIQSILTSISEKKDAAEASLIYKDSEQARNLLKEAVALIETIPADIKDYDSIVNEYRNQVNEVYFGIRGITQVDVNTLAVLEDGSQFSTTVEVDGVIYGITESLDLYRFQELEQNLLKETTSIGAINGIKSASAYENGFIFVDTNQRLARANVTVNTLNPIVSGLEKLQSVEDIILYNDNLYILTGAGQQIVKMRPQGDGFDGGTAWITANDTNIADAKSITVDGDVYVLTQTGIVKYTSGREQSFDLEAVDPPFSNPVDILTMVNDDYIYVLDPGEERIIVYKKSGEFVLQYTSPEFSSAKNIFVRNDKKLIFVTTGTKVLNFSASHLLD